MKSYRTLRPYFYRHRRRLALGLAALFTVDLLQLVIPRVIKNAVDHLTSLTATPTILAMAGLSIVGLALTIGVFRYIWRRLILGFSRIVEEDLRNRLYAKLLTLSPSWFLTRSTGDIMAHATNDLEGVRMAAGFGLVALVDSVGLGAAAVGFMIWINPKLTLLALLPMPLVTILTRRFSRLMFFRYRQVQNLFGGMTEQVREYLAGIRVIKAHAREKFILGEMDRVGRGYVRENIRLARVAGSLYPLMLMFTNLSLAIIFYFGGRLTVFGTITPGDFVAFISYLNLLTWPMMALGWVINLIQRGSASLDRINDILDQAPEITDPLRPVRVDGFRGEVKVKGLTFAYPGRSEEVLEGLELCFPAGRITALVGRTGSGKSTLLNLALRLFDPPAGTIFLDGIDIKDLSLSDLRGAVGYVPQDGYVFSGTVAENIAFGLPEIGEAELREAARAAELDEDLSLFPHGYQTFLGEGGLTLSGGQRQRLALARALILDAPLLILDDTMSAVDAATEERILANLAKVRAGRTTIIVAHRLSSLKIADLIHVIDRGRPAESGRHEELLARDGYYARLHRLQEIQAGMNQVEKGGGLEA